MEVYEKPLCGVIRITNAKTLEKWVQNGSFKEILNKGYIFNIGCGRFKAEKCTCKQCRKPNRNKELQTVINKHLK